MTQKENNVPTLIELIINRSLKNKITDDAITEAFESDPIARIFEKIAYWLASSEWDLIGIDTDLNNQVRDYLEAINAFGYLANAYKFASLFGTASLVLNPDWRDVGVEIIGIKHAGNQYYASYPLSELHADSFAFWGGQFGDSWRKDNQGWIQATYAQTHPLLEVGSLDSFRRIYPAYNAYLSSLEAAFKLASTGNVVILGSEELEEDRTDYPAEEYANYLRSIAVGIQNQLDNNGVCVFPGKPIVHQVNRSSNDLEKIIPHIRRYFQFATGLTEFHIFGDVSSGNVLAGSQQREPQNKADFVKIRREKFFKPVINFLIARFLKSIGESPNLVQVNFNVFEPLSAEEQSKIALNRAKREEIQIQSGILSPEEVRQSYFDKYVSDAVQIPEEKQEKVDSKINYRRKLWLEYKTLTNLSFDQLAEWREQEEAAQSKQDFIRINRNLILKTATEEEFLKSPELQQWARQTVQRIKKLKRSPDSKLKRICELCCGFDSGLPSTNQLPKSLIAPVAPTTAHLDSVPTNTQQEALNIFFQGAEFTEEELALAEEAARKKVQSDLSFEAFIEGAKLAPEEVINLIENEREKVRKQQEKEAKEEQLKIREEAFAQARAKIKEVIDSGGSDLFLEDAAESASITDDKSEPDTPESPIQQDSEIPEESN